LAYHDHDGCECLRPTPEIDQEAYETDRGDMVVSVNLARQICFQRDEARELLASEKATRNAIIAKGIETERQLAEAHQAFAIATDLLVQAQGELRQVREENKAQSETLKVMNDALKEAHRIFGNLSHSQVVQRLCPDFQEISELVRKSHDQHA
jgi:hypothetical protein